VHAPPAIHLDHVVAEFLTLALVGAGVGDVGQGE
jgi:hypothetical protein